jgi:hypothetical protein
VVDELRKPLAGVSVWLSYQVSETEISEPDEDREQLGFMRRFRLGATDADGRWLCSTIPSTQERYAFEFEHPDFVKNDSVKVGRDVHSSVDGDLRARLRARTLVTVMQAGAIAFGQVVSGAGEPVAGARISRSWHELLATSDAEGHFSVGSLPRGEISLTATADGFAPTQFQAAAGGGAARVHLDPGGVLRVRIEDTNGLPIAGARLVLNDGFAAGALGWDDQTGEDGRIEWRSAPPKASLDIGISAEGYLSFPHNLLRVDEPERTIRLLPATVVEGTVTDAVTGTLVPRFKAIPGRTVSDEQAAILDRSDLRYSTNGQFRLQVDYGVPAVRIEADGYDPETAMPRLNPEGRLQCDFQLFRAGTRPGIRGEVFNPDGTPAANVQIALGTFERGVMLKRGVFHRNTWATARTDGRGRFAVAAEPAAHTAYAVDSRGFGSALVSSNAVVRIHMTTLGNLEGQVLHNGKPKPHATLVLRNPASGQYPGALELDWGAFKFQADGTGRFRLDQVPAGDLLLSLVGARGMSFTETRLVTVLPGVVTRVNVGEVDPEGRMVVGRLRPSDTVPVSDWRQHVTAGFLRLATPVVTPPEGMSETERRWWLVNWHHSGQAAELLRKGRSYNLEVAADGHLSARGVRPGEYSLLISASPKEVIGKDLGTQLSAPWGGHVSTEVTIPPPNPASPSAPHDLGEIELTIRRRNQ